MLRCSIASTACGSARFVDDGYQFDEARHDEIGDQRGAIIRSGPGCLTPQGAADHGVGTPGVHRRFELITVALVGERR